MDPHTLSTEEVIQIHERLVQDFAEAGDPIVPCGVRSIALLESAISRQHTSLAGTLKYPGAIDNAATLMYGLCCDHPFHNGNKRTALVAMLVHLDRNRLSLFGVNQKDLFEMIIEVAQHTLATRKRTKGKNRPTPDEEVQAIANWISKRADKLIRGERTITYRELRRILEGFGYYMENPKGNSIEIVRYEKVKKGIFKRRTENERKHITSIGYPGETKEVGIKIVKQVRRICRLCEEDGVDSECFYHDTIVLDAFINRYRIILRRLARR